MAYATSQDVATRLGRDLDESEEQIVQVRLDDVERIIMTRLPDLHGMILDGELDQGLVIMIECEAVLRLIRNQEGYTSETDGNYTYSISSRVASGRIEILDHEWAMLGVARTFRVFSPAIHLGAGGALCHPQYPFNPPFYGHNPVHPAVWWGDDESA